MKRKQTKPESGDILRRAIANYKKLGWTQRAFARGADDRTHDGGTGLQYCAFSPETKKVCLLGSVYRAVEELNATPATERKAIDSVAAAIQSLPEYREQVAVWDRATKYPENRNASLVVRANDLVMKRKKQAVAVLQEALSC